MKIQIFFLLFRMLRDRHDQKDIKVWAVTGGLFGMLATSSTLKKFNCSYRPLLMGLLPC